ncbi:multicopper oxidase family protein [Deinococcus pimensis]|uniref:multicopper oxidase family protein n=1 Tax=Deinococcus pimensis TaxID=309888 RepID=UPI0004AD9C3C|nr:multicopper oxidase family protein [Deinococcus pimensis]
MIRPIALTALLTLALTACTDRGATTDTSLTEPSDLNVTHERGEARLTLTARRTPLTLAGRRVDTQVYDGQFPGPVLRVREGEPTRLTLDNQLDEPTTLHLHGLPVSPLVDNPWRSVAPGRSATYAFTLPKGSAGTYWYHTHQHGRSDTQLFAGLAGALVVTGDSEPATLRDLEEHVLVFKDAPGPQHDPMLDMNGRQGDVLVNGQKPGTLDVRSGLVRLRLVNAGNARYYNLTAGEQALVVIARDGHPLKRPQDVTQLLLAPGERADVLVRMDQQARVTLRDAGYDRGTHVMSDDTAGHADHQGADASRPATGGEHDMHEMHGGPQTPSGQDEHVLVTIRAPEGVQGRPFPQQPAFETLTVPGDAPVRQIVFDEQMNPTRFFLNGRAFDMDRVDLHASEGTVEVWELVNRTAMDHPFHLHTYAVQVVERDGRAVEPEWKDVVNVPAHGRVRIAVPLKTFTGRTVFHCHIAEHEERGMMGTLEVHAAGEPLPEAGHAGEAARPVEAGAGDAGHGGYGGHGGH